VKRFADGEYVAETEYHSWQYTIDLTPPKNNAATSHISWIGAGEGILMTDDLLPQFVVSRSGASADIVINVPTGWRSFSTDTTAGKVSVGDLRKGVIFLGTTYREKTLKAGSVDMRLAISGEWLFTDDEAGQMAKEILLEYARIFGSPPSGRLLIAMMKFQPATSTGTWEAETRGKTVTIMSSDMPFRTQSLQRLHEQLRHEIFHLWIPNGVKLTGNYAWFYEGFALYQSLKTAVAMNRIRFDDLLETLSRAYSIDVRQVPRRPLIDGDGRASGSADTPTYARGMLIAFMLDVAMLRESKGKVNVSDISRQIVQKYGSADAVEGNTAILEAIGRPEFAKRYILGVAQFKMEPELAGSGILLETSGRASAFKVVSKPNGREKEILDRLGYNNWRKGPKTTK
jgi:Predicted protease with the C-terminal PDZ domain